jgi:formate dehydrogenase subunit delta
MDIDHLVHMANRIAEFFEAMPDEAEARDGVAQHLQRYWEPRMRAHLIEHLRVREGAGLRQLVIDALTVQQAGAR